MIILKGVKQGGREKWKEGRMGERNRDREATAHK